MPPPFAYSPGQPRPLGATPRDGGVNFALYSEHAEAVELILYVDDGGLHVGQVILLEHRQHRSGHCWHVFVQGCGHGQRYAFRVRGPWAPHIGHRFEPRRALIDPYARVLVPRERDPSHPSGHLALRSGHFVSVVVDPSGFDWGDAKPPRTAATDRIIYEVHVRGFTKDPSSAVARPGTFDGLIEKLPYLVELGVTTLELLPIFAFDPYVVDRKNPLTGDPLVDFWGYNPLSFFAPHRPYLNREHGEAADSIRSLQELVRACHEHGLEVFLDVVYNHTGELGLDGPTHAFRAIDNTTYYIVKQDGSGLYLDVTGCGHTVRANHPAVRRMILDSLRYWVTHFHIDGFRFDLASVLSRDDLGRPIENPPVLWEIEGDPTLEHTTLIAEAWDAGGLYQVGRFPGERWGEWNGRFRDDVRRFWRGDEGMVGALAQRLLGSPDLYEHLDRQPSQCVNFITSHDGFTLADLVSHRKKRNLANGEGDKDGADEVSFTCGVDGPTDNPNVLVLRNRMSKNLLTTLFIAQGTPMLLAGDELGRTQQGNNNAWCQDNPVSWVDWKMLSDHAELHRFTRLLIRLRRSHPSLHRSRHLLGQDAPVGHDTPGYTRVSWHGLTPNTPDWSATNNFLAMSLSAAADDVALHFMLNASDRPLDVLLPTPTNAHRWLRALDTSLTPPHDIAEHGHEGWVGERYLVAPYSAVVLVEDILPPPSRVRPTQRMIIPTSIRSLSGGRESNE